MILLDLLFDQVTYPIKTQISKNYAMRVKKNYEKGEIVKKQKKISNPTTNNKAKLTKAKSDLAEAYKSNQSKYIQDKIDKSLNAQQANDPRLPFQTSYAKGD